MECKYLDFKSIKQVLLIVLISLPLAGCSVFEDDEYIDYFTDMDLAVVCEAAQTAAES